MRETKERIETIRSYWLVETGFLVVIALTAACSGDVRTSRDGGVDGSVSGAPQTARGPIPRLTDDGSLVRPEGWEAWVLAGTSIGLTYNEPASIPAAGEPPGTFLNVYLQPWAYQGFMDTGSFPEGTMFVLAGSRPVDKADPARGGFYQGELSLLEVHAKIEGVHQSGWGFYGFGGEAEAAPLFPPDTACYSCHDEEAAYDHVFAQFYPAIREKLVSEGLLDEDVASGRR